MVVKAPKPESRMSHKFVETKPLKKPKVFIYQLLDKI